MPDDCISIALGLNELRVLQEREAEHGIMVQVEYGSRGRRCKR